MISTGFSIFPSERGEWMLWSAGGCFFGSGVELTFVYPDSVDVDTAGLL